MNKQETMASAQYLSPVWPHYTDVLVDHAEGIYLYDVGGRRYIDFTCGIGVTNTGHCHPRVVRAAQEQCARLIDEGRLRIHVSATFPLADAAEAHRRIEAGGVQGKLVLVMEH